MNPGFSKTAALLVLVTWAGAGCENTHPEGATGPYSRGGSAGGGNLVQAAGTMSAQSMAVGIPISAINGAQIRVLLKHEATEKQRKLAARRAKTFYSRLPQEKKAALQKTKTRYILVDTARDEHTAPKAQKAVMLWDTQSQEVVGNDVYDVENTPSVGTTARFETYSAQYVGSGL